MSQRLEDIALGWSEPEKRGFGKWISGRARRREFWLWFAGAAAIVIALAVAHFDESLIVLGFSLPILVGMIRRLHDLGHSGWFAPVINIGVNVIGFAALTVLGPESGAIASALIYLGVLVVLGAVPGRQEANEYGPPPGRAGADPQPAQTEPAGATP